MSQPELVVIDPGTRVPELDCFNRIARNATLPTSYHLPAQQGCDSLARIPGDIAGILILGSGASVHDNEAWQHDMDAWLLPHLEAGVPALGLCYGHQHLAHRLGGDVGYLNDDHEKLRGVVTMHLGPNRLWGEATQGPVVISHREIVTRLPDGFRSLGRRDQVEIDAFGHDSRPIWGFQPHPEATMAFVLNNGIAFDADESILPYGHRFVDAFTAFCAKNTRQ